MSLLRKALESIEEEAVPTVNEPAPPSPEEGNQPNNEEKSVIMSGPLGQVYTQALAVAFAKPEHAETPSEPVTGVSAMETQANDALMAAAVIRAVTGKEAESVEDPEAMIYGVSAQHVDSNAVTEIASQMSQFELEDPNEFIVVVDATSMADKADNGVDPTGMLENAEIYDLNLNEVDEARLEKVELLPVLESMVSAMGGRVVYSFRQALECLGNPEVLIGDTPDKKENGDVGVDEEKEPKEKVTEIDGPKPEEKVGDKLPENIKPDLELEPSLESAKGGKKADGKKEDPKAKLNRAKNVINRALSKIKDKSIRADLHYAVGIIGSAQKDMTGKVAMEGHTPGQTLIDTILDILNTSRIDGIVNGLKTSKSKLESLEGSVRKGTVSDAEIISTCSSSAEAIKKGLVLIDEQQEKLQKATGFVNKVSHLVKKAPKKAK